MKIVKKIQFNKTAAVAASVGGVVLLVVGFLCGRYADLGANGMVFSQIRQSAYGNSGYKYINPLLGSSISGGKTGAEFASLKKSLQDTIDEAVRNGSATQVSVYFDTRDGRGMSINGDLKYSPASLIKVPIMVGVLAQAEKDPALLSKKIVYQGGASLNGNEYFKPVQTLQAGSSYTVDDLVRRMVVYSDNDALQLLVGNTDSNALAATLSSIGFPAPSAGSDDNITVDTYANVFRFLYNASFLGRDMSEKALGYLAQSDFSEGIKAGEPSGVEVAQKFGERNFSSNPLDPTSQKELHDCGIVYYPNHPYLLCVMTKGTDFTKLASVISFISQKTYQFIDKK